MGRRARLSGMVLIATLITGCATTPVERQEATVESLVELRETMAKTRAQVNETLAALITLLNAPSAQAQEAYRQYASAADTMAAQAERIEAETGRMRQRSEAWLAAWDEAHAEVQDPELKRVAQERREQIRARFENIEDSLVSARNALAPFVENLQDIKNVVGNDLTPRGIAAVSRTEVVRDATTNGREAAGALRITTADLRGLIKALAPLRAA